MRRPCGGCTRLRRPPRPHGGRHEVVDSYMTLQRSLRGISSSFESVPVLVGRRNGKFCLCWPVWQYLNLWLNWTRELGIFYDLKIHLKSKRKFYKMMIRLAMLYRVNCWFMNQSHEQNIRVTGMKVLGWMCKYMRMDRLEIKTLEKKLRLCLSRENFKRYV